MWESTALPRVAETLPLLVAGGQEEDRAWDLCPQMLSGHRITLVVFPSMTATTGVEGQGMLQVVKRREEHRRVWKYLLCPPPPWSAVVCSSSRNGVCLPRGGLCKPRLSRGQ